MNNFNQLEKKISKFLKLNPALHSKVKLFYQKFVYFLNKKNFFEFELNKDCEIFDLKADNSFFGYYDHTPWSKDMKHFILHVEKQKTIQLNLYTFLNNKISFKKTLVTSKFYNLQQGVRPIWINNDEIIFNQVIDNKLVSSIYNISNNVIKNFNFPVQELSVKNNIIFSIDYTKINFLNKDYGYSLKSQFFQEGTDAICGYDYIEKNLIFELKTNRIHQMSKNRNLSFDNCEINHLHHSPYDDSFIFIYRNKNYKGYSELYHYNYKTDNLLRLYSGKMFSHYCWINKSAVFGYLDHKGIPGFFEIDFKNNNSIIFSKNILNQSLDNTGDGHPSVSGDNKWIIYDSYPDKARQSHLYLIRNNNKTEKLLIGKFLSPLKFNGYNRCDLHPRWSPDGKFISIDSGYDGSRKSYLINVSKII